MNREVTKGRSSGLKMSEHWLSEDLPFLVPADPIYEHTIISRASASMGGESISARTERRPSLSCGLIGRSAKGTGSTPGHCASINDMMSGDADIGAVMGSCSLGAELGTPETSGGPEDKAGSARKDGPCIGGTMGRAGNR